MNGIELKVMAIILKTSIWPLIAFFVTPILDFIILISINDYSALSVSTRSFLDDSKLIISLLIVIMAFIKVTMGSIKIKKEIEFLKTNPPPDEKKL